MARKKTNPVKVTPFTERFNFLRKESGLTMILLSQKLGISQSHISLMASGDRHPSRELILKISEIFTPGDPRACDELLVIAGYSPEHKELFSPADNPITLYQQQLEKDPEDFRVYVALIRIFIKTQEHAKAEETIKKGMDIFRDSYQMQALMGQLELNRGKFKAAIGAQELALEYYEGEDQQERADLMTNIGVSYFLWGSHYFNLMQSETNTTKASEAKQLALNYFQQASQIYQKSLLIAPEDVYLLDEIARVNFNLADLSENNAEDLWQKTIDSFKQFICSPDNESMGFQAVQEANILLAHTYSRSGRLDEAELSFGMLACTLPRNWLVHYLRACMYNLKYAQSPQEKYLELSLHSLKKALLINEPNNYSSTIAENEPDLALVKQKKNHEFMQIIQGAKNEK